MVWQFFSAFLQRLICVRWYIIKDIIYIAVKNKTFSTIYDRVLTKTYHKVIMMMKR